MDSYRETQLKYRERHKSVRLPKELMEAVQNAARFESLRRKEHISPKRLITEVLLLRFAASAIKK